VGGRQADNPSKWTRTTFQIALVVVTVAVVILYLVVEYNELANQNYITRGDEHFTKNRRQKCRKRF